MTGLYCVLNNILTIYMKLHFKWCKIYELGAGPNSGSVQIRLCHCITSCINDPANFNVSFFSCRRPAAVCWCGSLPHPPVDVRTTLIILQHPFEVTTGSLLRMPSYGRADSRFAPNQWEAALLCNISHWLGANLESALYHVYGIKHYPSSPKICTSIHSYPLWN